jgi:hypothetical protein
MTLRTHPLMSYRGLGNWPPVWTWRGGKGENKRPQGEIGVLRDVLSSQVQPSSRIYLIMQCEGEEYMGCVLFNDSAFCSQICELLKRNCGKPLSEIGSLEIGHLI